MILFCVLFGLSMDYEVFLLSRMKEVWDRTGDNQEAVARGLERSGRIVTSAALIVVVVAGSFAFADIVLIKALGHRDGDRGRPRRDGRPGAARAGDDAPARPLELVAAGAGPARAAGGRRPRCSSWPSPLSSPACAAAPILANAAGAAPDDAAAPRAAPRARPTRIADRAARATTRRTTA